MSYEKKPGPPKPAPTFLVVSIPRAVFQRYIRQPWVDVLTAAHEGRDGLSITDGGYTCAPSDTAHVRELVMPGSTLHGQCSLVSQGW